MCGDTGKQCGCGGYIVWYCDGKTVELVECTRCHQRYDTGKFILEDTVAKIEEERKNVTD